MAGELIGIDWYNLNSTRMYPLSDEATGKDVDDSIELPTSFIVDFVLAVNTTQFSNSDGFFISEIALFGSGASIAVSYYNGSTSSEVARVSIPASHTKNKTYYIYGSASQYADVVGKITIGQFDDIQDYAGVYTFDINGGKLVSTCVKPDIRGVASITVNNNNDKSEKLTNNITLEAGSNVRIDVNSGSNTITISAIVDESFASRCDCVDTADTAQNDCIRSINGITADETGNISLSGSTCISVSNSGNTIKVENTCKTPCCDSDDLSKFVEDISTLEVDIRTQGFTMEKLDNKLDELKRLEKAIEATGFILS